MALSGGQTLAPGITFHPSDYELLHSFLRPRIRGHFPSTEFVHDADVYAADPADLAARYLPAPAGNGKNVWYFFTSVRAKNRRGLRKARVIGTSAGGWHSEAAPKPVLDDDRRRVGQRQSFSFMDKNGRRLGWVMAEFGLDQEEEESSPSPVMVVCKVYRSPRASRAKTSAVTSASLSGQKMKAAAGETGTCVRRRLSPHMAVAAPQTERAGPLEDEEEDIGGILENLEEALMSDEPDMVQCAETTC